MISRRRFLADSALTVGAVGVVQIATSHATMASLPSARLRPGGRDSGYDPWLEVDADAFRHNVREVSRLAGGRPILAVVKNNAYGIGDTLVGPMLASCSEVGGIACVRPAEALAMRGAGVHKPILTMSEVAEDEGAELVAQGITLSCWLDDSGPRLERIARRAHRTPSVHLYIDTGMNREGMPYRRALPWIEDLTRRPSIRVTGVYHMFVHQLAFDRTQHTRFLEVTDEARTKGLRLGTLHATPTYELFYLPESHLDMVRVGNALFGNYPAPESELAQQGDNVRDRAALKPVFRLKARVTRVEQLQPGESAGFGRAFVTERPTWVALLPVGHTDGYPAAAGGTCQVLIGGKLYPVVTGGVASAHTIVEIGPDKQVGVGDTATLIGGDNPAIDPQAVAAKTKVGFYPMITKFSASLPRRMM